MAIHSGDVFYYWVSGTADSGTITSTTGTDYTWVNWCDESGTASADDTWRQWNNTTVTYTTDTPDGVWRIWNSDDKTVPYVVEPEVANPKVRNFKKFTSPKYTREELRARAAQERIKKEWFEYQKEEQEKAKEIAELTARELLKDLITVEQFEYYKETGHLVVNGRKYDYVIEKGRGVFRVDKDKVHDLCIHLKKRYSFPATDNVIGLLLALQNNEKKFLKTANDHGEVSNIDRKKKVLDMVKRVA
jgi:hypothetical protein